MACVPIALLSFLVFLFACIAVFTVFLSCLGVIGVSFLVDDDGIIVVERYF